MKLCMLLVTLTYIINKYRANRLNEGSPGMRRQMFSAENRGAVSPHGQSRTVPDSLIANPYT